MRTTYKIALILLLAVVSSPAQENSIRQLFQSVLAQSAGGDLPATEELFSKVNETTVGALSAAEVTGLLPLARQCIQSKRLEVRQDGMVLFISANFRPDSAKLLEPYVDDLGTLLDGAEGSNSPRHAAMYVLGSMKPDLPPKAIVLLNAHLEDSRSSAEETLTIAASLLKAAPTDASTLHKVLLVVSHRSDPGLTNGVLRQLGLSKSRLPEALNFIAESLSQTDPHLRASAVDAVARLDRDERARFSTQLGNIASDPTETEDVRNKAKSVLEP